MQLKFMTLRAMLQLRRRTIWRQKCRYYLAIVICSTHLFTKNRFPRLARDISRDAIFKCDARLSTRSFFIHVRARFSSLLVRRTYVRGIMRKLPGYYERNGFCPVAALFRDRGWIKASGICCRKSDNPFRSRDSNWIVERRSQNRWKIV